MKAALAFGIALHPSLFKRWVARRWDTRARKHNDHVGRLIVPYGGFVEHPQ
jgi:hypothetical protein